MRQAQMQPRRPTNRRIVVGFLIACVLLLVVGPRIKPVASALSPVYSPVDAFISQVTNDVGTFVGSFVKAPGLESQNEKLRKQIAMLTRDLAQMPIYRREVTDLNRELQFSDLNPHLELVRGNIDGVGTPGLESTLQVTVGSDDGVHQDDPVLDQNGYLIGKVLEVSPASSTVGLLTDYSVNVPAMDAETGSQGLVQYHDGQVTLNDVESGRRLNTGDYIVTSAIGNDYPIGEVIGQIASLQTGTAQALNSATIATSASMDDLNYVQIIRKFGPGLRVHYGSESP